MHTRRLLFIAACAVPCQVALAQPSAPVADRVDAKSLMQSGLKLYAAQDYLGALAVFRTAYTRFPSAKILINIGTTLIKLDRKADAANTYQRYLDSPDTDPAKASEVKKALAELDKAVGTLELAVTPGDAEISLDGDEWTAAGATSRLRVPPGAETARVRRAAYEPGERQLRIAAGEIVRVGFDLVAIPTPTAAPAASESADTGVRAVAAVEAPPSRLGLIALAHVDVSNQGGAGVIGASYAVTRQLTAQAAVLLGPSAGGYVGATFAVLDRPLTPIVSVGAPIFGSDGARVALRGAAGLELALNRHISLIGELGVEHMLNAEADVMHRTLLVPAFGAVGRL